MVTYAENIKLILLSGTPMYHSPHEIIDVVNLLLINDGYRKIDPLLFFDKYNLRNTSDSPMIKHFERVVKGYISYIRKENPLTFAEKRFSKEKNSQGVSNYILDKFGKILSKKTVDILKEDSDKTIIVKCPLTKIHKASYLKFVDGYKGSDSQAIIQLGIYNFDTYPLYKTLKKSFKPIRLNSFKLDEQLKDMSAKIYQLVKNIRENPSNGPIFIYSNYIQFGIVPLSLALMANGILLHQFNLKTNDNLKRIADTGKTPIKLPLGYPNDKRYKDLKQNIPGLICYKCCLTRDKCKGSDHHFKPMKFDIIAGNTDNNNEIRKKFSHNGMVNGVYKSDLDNKNGRNIKILIGSKVLREGINLMHVRQVHILEPWHNKSRLEQVIGRALRFCSHVALPKEERNVTIYQYASILRNDEYDYKKSENKEIIAKIIETTLTLAQDIGQKIDISLARRPNNNKNLEPLLSYDIIMYKRSEVLSEKNKAIERILKRVSVDCAINKALNLDKNTPESEKYECYEFDKKLEDYTQVDIDKSTFDNIFLSPYVEYAISLIKNLFKKKSIVYHNDILKIRELKQLKIGKTSDHDDNNYIIEKALYELTPKLNNLSTFYHIFEGKKEEGSDSKPFGYIIARKISDKKNDTVYIFQELDGQKKERSIFEQLPMYHRRNFYKSNTQVPLKTQYNFNLFKPSFDQQTSIQQTEKKRLKLPRTFIKEITEHNDVKTSAEWRREAEVVGVELHEAKYKDLYWIRYNPGDPKTRPIPKNDNNTILLGRYKPGVRCDGLQSDMAKKVRIALMNGLKNLEPDNKDFESIYDRKKPDCNLMLKLIKYLNKIDKTHIWYKKLSSIIKKKK